MNFRAVYHLALVCLCAMACAQAQDPTKAAPAQYTHGPENKYIKVVYIHYAPHSKSPMHEHPAGVVVNVSDGHLRFTEADGKTHEISAKRGETRYFAATKHTVENLADTAYDGVYIEIKSAPTVSSSKNRAREEDPVMKALLLASTNARAAQPVSSIPATRSSGGE
jgi:beta-alanine degradation protein BauB